MLEICNWKFIHTIRSVSFNFVVNEWVPIYVRLPIKRIQLSVLNRSTDLELKGASRITLAALF